MSLLLGEPSRNGKKEVQARKKGKGRIDQEGCNRAYDLPPLQTAMQLTKSGRGGLECTGGDGINGLILMDGISSPGPPFGVWLFLGFELLTLAIEFIVLSIWIYFWKIKMPFDHICAVTFFMNAFSALVAFPIWQSLHIGGL